MDASLPGPRWAPRLPARRAGAQQPRLDEPLEAHRGDPDPDFDPLGRERHNHRARWALPSTGPPRRRGGSNHPVPDDPLTPYPDPPLQGGREIAAALPTR